MMIQAPCKGCEERQVGCHSTCEKYAEYKKKKNESKLNFARYIMILDYNARKAAMLKKRIKR